MDHVLVCLSSSPSNKKTIEEAYRLVQVTQAKFSAIYVETSHSSSLSSQDQKRLQENHRLAQKLGASLEVVYGEDISREVSRYIQMVGVSDVVIGRSALKSRNPFKKTIMAKLLEECHNVEFHIVSDYSLLENFTMRNSIVLFHPIQDLFSCVSILFVTTLIGFVFESMGFTKENIITIYILSVLIISIITTNKGFSLISSIISVIVFNFFFTDPKYTLFVYEQGYPVTFFVMFLSAFMTGTLASRLKSIAKQSSMRAYRTKILLDTDQAFTKTQNKKETINVLGKQLVKLLQKDIVIYNVEENKVVTSYSFWMNEDHHSIDFEEEIVDWVCQNNRQAGYGTKQFGDSKALYLSIQNQNNVYGVVGISIKDNPLESFEMDLLIAILQECALNMENISIQKEKEEAALLAQKEKLRANLLRGISHDLRTPLTTISGNANILMTSGMYLNEETKEDLYKSIFEDSVWLTNVVENLLSVSRIEEGRMNVCFKPELVEELIEEAVHHIDQYKKKNTVKIEIEDSCLLIKADARLIMQLLSNLLDNALKYAGEEVCITIRAYAKNEYAHIEVQDDGPGISAEDIEHIFETFYIGHARIVDSKRSLGLGLSLCKNIVDLHNGSIEVFNVEPHGACFRIKLPIEKVIINE
ncbi:MAG: ATP-binding protein [Bacillota bacterium]|nr:ATP-binding protein [Bacillota bacterium]